jgi:hypothetical protein
LAHQAHAFQPSIIRKKRKAGFLLNNAPSVDAVRLTA